MRLELLPLVGRHGHQELASGVCWGSAGDFYTASDDGSVQRWSGRGESVGKVSWRHLMQIHPKPPS